MNPWENDPEAYKRKLIMDMLNRQGPYGGSGFDGMRNEYIQSLMFPNRWDDEVQKAQAHKINQEANWIPYVQLRQGNFLGSKASHNNVLPKSMNTIFGSGEGNQYLTGGMALWSMLPHLSKSGIG